MGLMGIELMTPQLSNFLSDFLFDFLWLPSALDHTATRSLDINKAPTLYTTF